MTKHLTVFIGRFQPLHNGHMSVIRTALAVSDHLLVLVGCIQGAPTSRNPFSFNTRYNMIFNSVTSEDEDNGLQKLSIRELKDCGNDTLWAQSVQKIVEQTKLFAFGDDEDIKVSLIGHNKDHTSYYLKMFPQWDSTSVGNVDGIDATNVRKKFFDTDSENSDISKLLPDSVVKILNHYSHTQEYKNILDEIASVKSYHDSWATINAQGLPVPRYTPIFVTVDSVVVQNNHVLLIKRKNMPGRDTFALPGGYLNSDETIANAWIRELMEETGANISKQLLQNSLRCVKVFDSPHRDVRGRLITHVHLVVLPDVAGYEQREMPVVTAGDDASQAFWMPIGQIVPEYLFADHYTIIQTMINSI